MRALVVTAPRQAVEVISDRLWMLGVAAIEERPAPPAPGSTGEGDGDVELWTTLGEDPDPVVGALVSAGLPRTPGPGPDIWWRWEEVDTASADIWRDHVVDIEIAPSLRIVPSWRVERTAPADPGEILLDPGAAFGMGDHPTTQMSLSFLLEALQAGDHVIDLGCGSGILAIAAIRRGAARVTAIDISPAALEATRANAQRNGVLDQVTTATEVAPHQLPADLVVANILTPTLIELSATLHPQAIGARALILSGLLGADIERVVDAFAPWSLVTTTHHEGWAALLLQSPASAG